MGRWSGFGGKVASGGLRNHSELGPLKSYVTQGKVPPRKREPHRGTHMQARFYLPMWGRFASPDPARDQHFEETQSWNIYSYVQNNPVMHTDPTGMFTFKEGWEKVKNFFNYERHSSSSVSKAPDGGTVTTDKVDVQRKVSLSGGQAKAQFSYESHKTHNELSGEKKIGPVFVEGGATQTKGSLSGSAGAEAGLKGVKADIGAGVGPSLSGNGGIGFRVADFKVTLAKIEVGAQIKLGAEAKVATRESGGFTLVKARVFAIGNIGFSFVDVKRENK